MIEKITALLTLGILVSAPRTFAAFGFKSDGTLDKTAISKSYFESDFARIRPPLEAWRTSHAQKTRDDSVFVFKYLSVIYAADSTTKEKSKSFMF